jgi:hypothetical protein
MKHYDFTQKFSEAYDKAVDLYARGRRGAETYFSPDESAWLAANGLTPQHLYDYAEDQNNAAEPGYDRALAIELVRRDYFLNVQGGVASSRVLAEASLPAKGEQIEGIEWLPRLIPKAKAKLRGELPATLMYCCGGDRKFFKARDILPAEFLSLVWRLDRDEAQILAWVVARSQAGS